MLFAWGGHNQHVADKQFRGDLSFSDTKWLDSRMVRQMILRTMDRKQLGSWHARETWIQHKGQSSSNREVPCSLYCVGLLGTTVETAKLPKGVHIAANPILHWCEKLLVSLSAEAQNTILALSPEHCQSIWLIRKTCILQQALFRHCRPTFPILWRGCLCFFVKFMHNRRDGPH